jgi:hypothetical protein
MAITPMTVQDIAAVIRGKCLGITGNHSAMMAAKDTMDGENRALTNVRLSVCKDIADLSQIHQWSEGDLEQAVKLAVATPSNNQPGQERTEKATAVFCSQIKAVAKPGVRGQFPTILAAIQTAWAAEQQEIALAKTEKRDPKDPLRKFVSREYEMVLRACREIHKGETGLDLRTPDDVVQWAILNDPDFDAERVAKRVKALATVLHDFYQDFPHAALDAAKQAIASVPAKQLVEARNVKLAADAARLAAMPLRGPVPVPVAPLAIVPTPDPGPSTAAEPAEGVINVDTLMNDAPVAELLAAD